jgi:hypothetical protein
VASDPLNVPWINLKLYSLLMLFGCKFLDPVLVLLSTRRILLF